MRSTGIVRKVDEVGRIVLPIELRRNLDIDVKDPIEIFIEEDKIILRKYQVNMACAITGEVAEENRTYGNGNLVLGQKGVELLLQELETKIKVTS
jgi:transcriptional pleiotropic regulator of transition state genes